MVRHLLGWVALLGLVLGIGAGCTGQPRAASVAALVPSPTPSHPSVTITFSPTPSPLPPLFPTATFLPSPTPQPAFDPPSVRFAVIGDYGQAGWAEQAVADLVHSWSPDFIVTTGDNNYPSGEWETIEENIGQYYGQDIAAGRFFPIPGNHDWGYGDLSPYLAYFHLPGNERYYDFTWGPVHFFMLDSDWHEPDGIKANSRQARWLRERLAEAREPWKLVLTHHAPFSSGHHGDRPNSQWPYAAWGATAVLSGHDHTYERILRDGIVYFVNGLGGAGRYDFERITEGSVVRFNADYGAMLVEADAQHITFRFITIQGETVDTYTLHRP